MDHLNDVDAMVYTFHEAMGRPIDVGPSFDVRDARLTLVAEEFLEASEELVPEKWDPDRADAWTSDPVAQKARLAKELADLVYTTYGAAIELGIDLDEAVRIVHRSNMSKVWPDGSVHYRADGKVLKPPGYIAPDMSEAVL